jgi:hypothetical protein
MANPRKAPRPSKAKPLLGEAQLQYKTIRGQRWVFANGKEVGTIDPMIPVAGRKWAFIPLAGYGTDSPDPFKEIIYGKTIGDVRRSLGWKVGRKERRKLLGLPEEKFGNG